MSDLALFLITDIEKIKALTALYFILVACFTGASLGLWISDPKDILSAGCSILGLIVSFFAFNIFMSVSETTSVEKVDCVNVSGSVIIEKGNCYIVRNLDVEQKQKGDD